MLCAVSFVLIMARRLGLGLELEWVSALGIENRLLRTCERAFRKMFDAECFEMSTILYMNTH